MPLLVPGLNEAATKTLAKRLHKSLKQHSGMPSLTQLQTMLVQAAGHPDWYSAQNFWQARLEAHTTEAHESDYTEGAWPDDTDSQLSQAMENIEKAQLERGMNGIIKAMEDAYPPHNGSLMPLSDHLDSLEEICKTIGNDRATAMVYRLTDLIRKAENPAVFPERREALDRMQPLVTRLHFLLLQRFYPKAPLRRRGLPG